MIQKWIKSEEFFNEYELKLLPAKWTPGWPTAQRHTYAATSILVLFIAVCHLRFMTVFICI